MVKETWYRVGVIAIAMMPVLLLLLALVYKEGHRPSCGALSEKSKRRFSAKKSAPRVISTSHGRTSARSIGPCRDKWIVFDVLTTASIAPYKTDGAGVGLRLHGSIELTLTIVVAIQTGATPACGVCAMPCEQRGKKERSDNKLTFPHKHLRGRSMR